MRPPSDEMFWAEKGGGAFVDREAAAGVGTAGGDRLGAVRHRDTLRRGGRRRGGWRSAHTLGALMPQVAGIRRFGAAALDLAWVSAGRYDGSRRSCPRCRSRPGKLQLPLQRNPLETLSLPPQCSFRPTSFPSPMSQIIRPRERAWILRTGAARKKLRRRSFSPTPPTNIGAGPPRSFTPAPMASGMRQSLTTFASITSLDCSTSRDHFPRKKGKGIWMGRSHNRRCRSAIFGDR